MSIDISSFDTSNFIVNTTPQPDLTDPNTLIFINSRLLEAYRDQRNKLLTESDKYIVPDYPISSDNIALIRTYRQQLRNYPDSEEVHNCLTTGSNLIPQLPKFPILN